MKITAIVIQARLDSKRLPRKILADICGRTMLERVLRRAAAVNVNGVKTPVVISCPRADATDIFGATGVFPHATIEDGRDVLSRMIEAARSVDADHVVRVTADCPLICPTLLRSMIESAYEGSTPVHLNWMPRSFPDGLDAEVYECGYLDDLSADLTEITDREWFASHVASKAVTGEVTPHLSNGPDGCVRNLSVLHRWTVDYPEDLDFMRAIYTAMGDDVWNTRILLNYLDCHPSVRLINAKRISDFGARPECS